MRASILLAGVATLLAGCGNEQKRVEDGIRNQLSSSGTVSQVSMTKQADGGWQGNATVRMADGHDARVNCRTDANGQGSCNQVIDQQLIDATTAAVRQQYTSRGFTVVDIQMAKQNDDLIAGDGVVRDPSGNQLNVHCTAPRDQTSRLFGLNCEQLGAGAAAAPAEGGQEAPAEDAQ